MAKVIIHAIIYKHDQTTNIVNNILIQYLLLFNNKDKVSGCLNVNDKEDIELLLNYSPHECRRWVKARLNIR